MNRQAERNAAVQSKALITAGSFADDQPRTELGSCLEQLRYRHVSVRDDDLLTIRQAVNCQAGIGNFECNDAGAHLHHHKYVQFLCRDP